MARPRSDIRPRVIEAARVRYLKDGVDGASLRGIATEAGTSIGMIYYYFKTKDDLFLGVVEDVYVGLLEDISAIAEDDSPADERIRRLYARLGRMSDIEFETIAIVVREALISSSRLESLMGRFSQGHLPLIVKLLHDGVQQGVITDRHPLPLMMVSMGAVGILPQMIRRLIARDSPLLLNLLPEGEILAKMLAEVILHGIAKGERGDDE